MLESRFALSRLRGSNKYALLRDLRQPSKRLQKKTQVGIIKHIDMIGRFCSEAKDVISRKFDVSSKMNVTQRHSLHIFKMYLGRVVKRMREAAEFLGIEDRLIDSECSTDANSNDESDIDSKDSSLLEVDLSKIEQPPQPDKEKKNPLLSEIEKKNDDSKKNISENEKFDQMEIINENKGEYSDSEKSTAPTQTKQVVMSVQAFSLRFISESKKTGRQDIKNFSNLCKVDSFLATDTRIEEGRINNYLVIRNKNEDLPDSIYHCTSFDSNSNFSFLCTNKGKILDLRVLPLFSGKDEDTSPNLIILAKQMTPSEQPNGQEVEELILYNISTSRKKLKSLLKLKMDSNETVGPLALKHLQANGMFEFAVMILKDTVFYSRNTSTKRWFSDLSSTMSTIKIPLIELHQTIALNLDSCSSERTTESKLVVLTKQKSDYFFHLIDPRKKPDSESQVEPPYRVSLANSEGSYLNVVLNTDLGFFAALGYFREKEEGSSGAYINLLFIDYTQKQLSENLSEKSVLDRPNKQTISISRGDQSSFPSVLISKKVKIDWNASFPEIQFAEKCFSEDKSTYYVIIFAMSYSNSIAYCMVHRKGEKLFVKKHTQRISELKEISALSPEKNKHKITSISKSIFIHYQESKPVKASVSVTLTEGYTFHLNIFLDPLQKPGAENAI